MGGGGDLKLLKGKAKKQENVKIRGKHEGSQGSFLSKVNEVFIRSFYIMQRSVVFFI